MKNNKPPKKTSKFVKISRPGMGFYIQPIAHIGLAIDAELDGAELDEEIHLSLIEMSQEKYNSLSEFTGW